MSAVVAWPLSRATAALNRLPLVAEADAECQRLLPERAFGPLHHLGDLGHRGLGLRVLLQQLDVGRGIGFPRQFLGSCLLSCLGQLILLLIIGGPK